MTHNILVFSLQVRNERDFEAALKLVGAGVYVSTQLAHVIHVIAHLIRRKSIILPSEVSVKQQI